MADIFLSNLKSTLDNCITELDEIHSMFCRNPESDFTRNRKLSFREYIQFMLQMQSKSVSNEILDFFEHSLSAPSKSAFTQQRYKLLPEGWRLIVTLTLFGPSLWQTVVTKVLIPLHT